MFNLSDYVCFARPFTLFSDFSDFSKFVIRFFQNILSFSVFFLCFYLDLLT